MISMSLAIMVATMTSGAFLSRCEDSGLEFRILDIALSGDGSTMEIQLRWSDPKSPWVLKKKEVVYVEKVDDNPVTHKCQVTIPNDFLTKKDDSCRIRFHVEQRFSVGDIVSVELGRMKVIGIASDRKKP